MTPVKFSWALLVLFSTPVKSTKLVSLYASTYVVPPVRRTPVELYQGSYTTDGL